MKIHSPNDLLFDQMKDIYSVESQVILTLPELAETATDRSLRSFLIDHEGESFSQKQRITAIFDRHGLEPDGDICQAIRGLIEGGNAHLVRADDPMVRDLLLIAHCNRIKYYEIAAYSFAAALAACIGFTRDGEELNCILEEEKACARHLTSIADDLFGSPFGACREAMQV